MQQIPDYSASGRRRFPWDPEGLRVNPHMFRHTFAAWQIRKGTDIAVVAGMLGHRNIQLTYDTYGHVQPEKHLIEMSRVHRPGRTLRVVDDQGEKEAI